MRAHVHQWKPLPDSSEFACRCRLRMLRDCKGKERTWRPKLEWTRDQCCDESCGCARGKARRFDAATRPAFHDFPGRDAYRPNILCRRCGEKQTTLVDLLKRSAELQDALAAESLSVLSASLDKAWDERRTGKHLTAEPDGSVRFPLRLAPPSPV